MLFETPEIIKNIPEIKQIYALNEEQEGMLDASVEALREDIFMENMDEMKTKRWEKILGLSCLDTDTLSERRFRIQTKVLERVPYSYRVVLRKLKTLCPEGITWDINAETASVVVRVALASRNMRSDVEELLENIVPLNMTCTTIILFNTNNMLKKLTYNELKKYTHQEIREDISIGGA